MVVLGRDSVQHVWMMLGRDSVQHVWMMLGRDSVQHETFLHVCSSILLHVYNKISLPCRTSSPAVVTLSTLCSLTTPDTLTPYTLTS